MLSRHQCVPSQTSRARAPGRRRTRPSRTRHVGTLQPCFNDRNLKSAPRDVNDLKTKTRSDVEQASHQPWVDRAEQELREGSTRATAEAMANGIPACMGCSLHCRPGGACARCSVSRLRSQPEIEQEGQDQSNPTPPRVPPARSIHIGLSRVRSISKLVMTVIAAVRQPPSAARAITMPPAMTSPMITGTSLTRTTRCHGEP
jgi:hypothetical protein